MTSCSIYMYLGFLVHACQTISIPIAIMIITIRQLYTEYVTMEKWMQTERIEGQSRYNYWRQ